MRKRGLLRTAARTAVVAGTAQSVAGRVAQRQQRKFARSSNTASSAAAVEREGSGDLVARLKQLAELRASGALSEKEYAAAKTKVLAS